MGGRGQKSSLVGVPRNKKKALNSLRENITKHKQKINNAINEVKGYDKRNVNHWQKEIKAWEEQIKRIERRYKK